MRFISIIIFIIFSFSNIVNAQRQSKIDSLTQLLRTAKSEKRMDILVSLSNKLEYANPKQAINYGFEALRIAERLNDTTGIIKAYINIGNAFRADKHYSKALYYERMAYNISKSANDKRGMSVALTNLGYIFNRQEKNDSAIYYVNQSLKIKKEQKDTSGYIFSYNAIGNIYFGIGNLELAIENYKLSLKFSELKKDTLQIISALINLGSASNDKSLTDISGVYLTRAEKLLKFVDADQLLSACYSNLATLYQNTKDYHKAIKYKYSSIKIDRKMDDAEGICINYNTLGNIYFDMKDYKKALSCQDTALIYSIKSDNKVQIYYAYESLGNIHFELKNYKLSAMFKDSAFVYKNLASSQETKNKISELQTIYEIENTEHENELLKQTHKINELEIAEQKTFKIWLFAFIFILFVIIFIVVRNIIIKKKANKILTEKNIQINQQNEEITSQRDEIEAQRDEIIAQRDMVTHQKEQIEEIHLEVTDSINYAKRIQEAVLPDLPNIFKDENANALNLDYFILFMPKGVVSGDFYWSTKIKNYLIVTVADCTGHGVPGAFMSMLGISFLNEIVRKNDKIEASQILNELRKSIIYALKQKGQSGEQKDGMDLVLVVLNTDTLEMQFAGAHNPLYLIKSDISTSSMTETASVAEPVEAQLIEIAADKMPVSIYERMDDFTNNVIQLEKGDIMYLTTDGYADQFGGPKEKKFMSRNMKEILRSNSQKPMNEQKQIYETTIKNWMGNLEQIDDITLMGIRI